MHNEWPFGYYLFEVKCGYPIRRVFFSAISLARLCSGLKNISLMVLGGMMRYLFWFELVLIIVILPISLLASRFCAVFGKGAGGGGSSDEPSRSYAKARAFFIHILFGKCVGAIERVRGE